MAPFIKTFQGIWKTSLSCISEETLFLMKKTFNLSVPRPCHEKFEEFNTTTLGGFCSSCQKEVIDFTTWDEDRIKSFFKDPASSTCGRFYPRQLKSYTLMHAPKFNFMRWTYVPLISMIVLLFSRNTQAQKIGKTRVEQVLASPETRPIVGDTVRVKVITGLVKAANDGTAIPGVHVLLRGTTNSTATNVDGQFSITVTNPQPTDSLEFSFIGFKSVAVNINESNDLTVAMKLDTVRLGEMVVIAGHVRRQRLRNLGWRIGNLFRRN